MFTLLIFHESTTWTVFVILFSQIRLATLVVVELIPVAFTMDVVIRNLQQNIHNFTFTNCLIFCEIREIIIQRIKEQLQYILIHQYTHISYLNMYSCLHLG